MMNHKFYIFPEVFGELGTFFCESLEIQKDLKLSIPFSFSLSVVDLFSVIICVKYLAACDILLWCYIKWKKIKAYVEFITYDISVTLAHQSFMMGRCQNKAITNYVMSFHLSWNAKWADKAYTAVETLSIFKVY